MSAAAWLARRIRPLLPEPSRWLRLGATLGLLAAIPIGLADLSRPGEVGQLWWAVALSALWALLWIGVMRQHWPAALLIAAGGLGFVAQVQGRVLPPLASGWAQAGAALRWLAGQTALWLGRTLPFLRVKVKLPTFADFQAWAAALDRLGQFVANLRVGGPVDLRSGSLLATSLFLLAIWLCAAGIVWLVIQRRSWASLLAALSLLAAGTTLTGTGWMALGMALMSGLLVAASDRLDDKLSRWGDEALPYGFSTQWWLWSLGVALLAWSALAGMVQITDPDFQQSLHDALIRDQTARPEEGNGSQAGSGGGPIPGVWPRQHLLGSGPELSEYPIMTISIFGAGSGGYYWKATSFDAYTGRGWLRRGTRQTVTDGQPGDYDAEQPPEGMSLLRQSVRFENATNQIYAAGTPVRISQPVEVFWLAEDVPDLVTVQSLSPLVGYEALSWVPTVTADDLRADDGELPAWVTEYYLLLPDELPERVRTLAADLTADAPSAYDQALALESYLRSYPYTLDLPDPPESGDMVDYFLFDLQRGYCDYYATSMVIMARSVGLPARLAVGYATGSYDAETDAYHVTLAEAHSWPEIYFSGFGWIPFEPTPARPLIERGAPAFVIGQPEPPLPEQIVAGYEEAAQAMPSSALARRLRWGVIGGGTVILLLIIGVLGRWLWMRRQLARLSNPDRIDLLYRRLVKHGARLGVTPSATQTPAEFRSALLAALDERKTPGREKVIRRIRLAVRGIEALCAAYAHRHYSRHQPEDADALLSGWPDLSRALWWLWLFSRPASTGRSR